MEEKTDCGEDLYKRYSTGEAFIVSSQMVKKLYERMWSDTRKHYELTQNEIDVLLLLKNFAPMDTAGDIARCRALSRSLVSKSVESLIQCGYLDGEPDSRDRRYFHLKLTEKAEQVLREMQKIRSNFWSMLQEGVTPEEMEQFLRVLGKMRHNLEKILPQGQE